MTVELIQIKDLRKVLEQQNLSFRAILDYAKLYWNVSFCVILCHFWYILCIFAVTVRTTLPTRTASQGASFAFKKLYNTPAMPLLLSTLSGFFRAYV